MANLIIPFILVLISNLLLAQDSDYNWILIKESDNIEICYRESDTLHYEELRFTTIYNASTQEITDVIRNIDELPNWSYLCVETQMINYVGPNEYYFYYATDTPWPLTDRDIALRITIIIDSLSGITTIHSVNIEGIFPEKSGFVRIPRHNTRWVLTPLADNKTGVEFYFSSDPGGIIPTWLMNSAVSYGPIKTLNTLKGIVESDVSNASDN